MKINRLAILPVLVIFPLLTSCGKVPQAEIDAATVAVENAKTAQADLYVQAEFMALQDSLSAVMAAIETEKSKLFKSFKDETEKLTAVVTLAGQVAANAQMRKQEMKAEAETILAALMNVMTENEALLVKAPKGKEGRAALEAIKGDLDVITSGIADAQALLASDDVINALNKVQALKDKADAINVELTGVIEKYSARRK